MPNHCMTNYSCDKCGLQYCPRCEECACGKKYATLTTFYADTLAGTTGEVKKRWVDTQGNWWVRLYFGNNLSGQRITKNYPQNVLSYNYQPITEPIPFKLNK